MEIGFLKMAEIRMHL